MSLSLTSTDSDSAQHGAGEEAFHDSVGTTIFFGNSSAVQCVAHCSEISLGIALVTGRVCNVLLDERLTESVSSLGVSYVSLPF